MGVSGRVMGVFGRAMGVFGKAMGVFGKWLRLQIDLLDIGHSYDVKHFLAHNVTLQNLKTCFSPLTRQHITSVFRNLHFGWSC